MFMFEDILLKVEVTGLIIDWMWNVRESEKLRMALGFLV